MAEDTMGAGAGAGGAENAGGAATGAGGSAGAGGAETGAATAAGATAGAADTAGGSDAAGAGGALAGLSDEYQQALAPKGFKSPDDLAKAYVDLEKKIGAKGIVKPGEDASDEEKAAFYAELGRPEDPTGYDLGDFKPPEGMAWSEERQGEALKALHGLGLNNEQARGVLDLAVQDQQRMLEEAGLRVESPTEVNQQLDAEVGPQGSPKRQEFEANAQRGAAVLGLDAQSTDQLAMRAGNTKLLQVLAKVGGLTSEDGELVGRGGGVGSAATPAGAKAEIEKIRNAARDDPKHPYNDSKHPEHKQIHQRMMDLYATAQKGEGS